MVENQIEVERSDKFQENENDVMTARAAAQATLKKPFLKLSQLRKGESIEVKIVGGYGKPDKPSWGKKKEEMTHEELEELKTYYMYDFKILKGSADYVVGAIYEYACPITYYKDVLKDTESGDKRLIRGLDSMFAEGHRTFKIMKVHEGKSTVLRNYTFTALDEPGTGRVYN